MGHSYRKSSHLGGAERVLRTRFHRFDVFIEGVNVLIELDWRTALYRKVEVRMLLNERL
jgi:hypothetical protein